MDALKKVRPLVWVLIVGWLALVIAAYYYVYTAEWFNNASQKVTEMTNLQSSLLQEEGVYGAGVSISNFYSSNDAGENSRSLNVILNATEVCLEYDASCENFLRQIAEKVLNEYPQIDSFTHLNIGVQQNWKFLLIINLSKTIGDSKTIDEWREEIRKSQ